MEKDSIINEVKEEKFNEACWENAAQLGSLIKSMKAKHKYQSVSYWTKWKGCNSRSTHWLTGMTNK